MRVAEQDLTGWLQRGKPFPLGAMPPEVYAALTDLAKEPWRPSTFLGWHTCDLCLSDLPATGYQNVFIPGDGVIYGCPELVTHYMGVQPRRARSAGRSPRFARGHGAEVL